LRLLTACSPVILFSSWITGRCSAREASSDVAVFNSIYRSAKSPSVRIRGHHLGVREKRHPSEPSDVIGRRGRQEREREVILQICLHERSYSERYSPKVMRMYSLLCRRIWPVLTLFTAWSEEFGGPTHARASMAVHKAWCSELTSFFTLM
jgi:hypothetical protein